MRKVYILVLYKNEEEKDQYLKFGSWNSHETTMRKRRGLEEYESDTFIIRCRHVGSADGLRGQKADILAVERSVYEEMVCSGTDHILQSVLIAQIVAVDIQIF